MSTRNFHELLEARWAAGKFLCVGLDSDFGTLLQNAEKRGTQDLASDYLLWKFNESIVEATHCFVCAFKPNLAFYEELGDVGLRALRKTITHIRRVAPEVPVVLDGKRGDIGNTNIGYVRGAFEFFDADAVTVSPYLGGEALTPFLQRADKGIFVLCRTSNKGAGEFQDLAVRDENTEEPLYQCVARRVANHWNTRGNCGLVVGATCPDELAAVRRIAPKLPILIPGVGAQGGDLEKSVAAGMDAQGEGFIISVSRSIIFASTGEDFADAAYREAERLADQIYLARIKAMIPDGQASYL